MIIMLHKLLSYDITYIMNYDYLTIHKLILCNILSNICENDCQVISDTIKIIKVLF